MQGERASSVVKGFAVLVLLCLLSILPSRYVSAAKTPKTPTKVVLNKTSVSLLPGKSFTLKATVTPARVREAGLKWTSSNKKVATVNEKGKVKVAGFGTAKITAKTVDGKKAVCVVKGTACVTTGKYIIVQTKDGERRSYRRYAQMLRSGYLRSTGCVQVAVAIIASAFGKNYTPEQIHSGSSSAVYSELYALKKMHAYSGIRYGRLAITIATASQILKDMGIPNKPVYTVSPSAAAKALEKHVKSGKPALLKANNRYADGVSVAVQHHAIVLAGIDEDGNGIFIEPWNAAVNYAHGNRRYFKMSIQRFVMNHMFHTRQSRQGAFISTYSDQGGYILVG